MSPGFAIGTIVAAFVLGIPHHDFVHLGAKDPAAFSYDALGRTLETIEPVGQLVGILDAKSNATTMTYDLLGRRTTLTSPDTGLTEFTFDAAGNLVKKVDENLRAAKQAISYRYSFGRLVLIDHPVTNDIAFDYGGAGAPENAAGRITRIEDEAGSETRGYDKLGNLVRSTREIVGLKPGAKSRTYTTRFAFDMFGRMLSLEYPDGEVLSYDYDAGGLLKAASGQQSGEREQYLKSLTYDP